MYNGQPPPQQAGGSLPPFPPNFTPGGPPPNGFPPFAPGGQFVPPPFPPNFAPQTSPPNHNGFNSPIAPGFRPPPGAPGMGFRPPHPGLGAQPGPGGPMGGPPRFPGPGGLPPPGMGSNGGPSGAPPGFQREVKTTSVFVGSIAPGIDDDTLKGLLNACGPLHQLKRVIGASGKPQAFGFALFENPEVVMRCIRCLNGVELPDLSPEGRREQKKKALVVKVDDKTREFLEEFESTLGRTADDEEADASCRKFIAHSVALMTNPNASAPAGIEPERPSGGKSPIEVIVPAHLQDLQEGDLPEHQRVVVLDQIAIFRENAARREREKKRLEDEKERYKAMEASNYNTSQSSAAGGGYGYGGRTFGREMSNQRQQQQQQQQQMPQRQWGPGSQDSPNNAQSSDRRNGDRRDSHQRDPQGYDQPVNFVKAQHAGSKVESERTDEEEEEIRQQRLKRDKDHALRDREARVERRERQRLDNLNRELAHRRQQADHEERLRQRQIETYASWDDDEKAERGRELFYADRSRWRAQRQSIRKREFQDDLRDRHQEEEEIKALERESEEFLKRQMEEMAQLEQEQKKAGLLTEDAAPIRLNIAAAAVPVVTKKVEEAETVKPKPKIAFEGDEDEENEANKKKRTLVKLEYGGDGLTDAEKIAKRNAKLLEIKGEIPKDRRRLWATNIEWAAISEQLLNDKIRSFVHGQMRNLLGEVDEDLADFIFEHLREHKGPDNLFDDLEPVFAEEATSFVTALWRQLAFESAAYVAGYETGNVMA